jgi:hypothetical protein
MFHKCGLNAHSQLHNQVDVLACILDCRCLGAQGMPFWASWLSGLGEGGGRPATEQVAVDSSTPHFGLSGLGGQCLSPL